MKYFKILITPPPSLEHGHCPAAEPRSKESSFLSVLMRDPRIAWSALLLLFFTLLASGASAQDAPSIKSVITPQSTADYETGQKINIIVSFRPAGIEVNTETGTPTIGLDIGGEIKTAGLTNSSPSSGGYLLFFGYRVEEGDSDYDGISVPANSFRLNGAAITSGGVDANIEHDELRTSYRVNVPTEREILGILYGSTNGEDWSNNEGGWATDIPDSVDLNDLHGVTVSAGKITRLNLQTNQLSGPIPPELGLLTELGTLVLDRNKLSGPIPAELGNLSNLEVLYLYGNQLDGTIPASLGMLSSLKILWLNDNELSGPIPPELGNLTKLTRLRLHENQLNGPIPTELESLENLQYLHLENNQLEGPIPPELGMLTELWEMHLDNNQLSGMIPASLGMLSSLKRLNLDNNQLSGPIPPELGMLTELWELRLQYNQLEGPIPPELGNLEAHDVFNIDFPLLDLNLSNNPELTGTLPQGLIDLMTMHAGVNVITNCTGISAAECPQERLADILEILYQSTNGERWSNSGGGWAANIPNSVNLNYLYGVTFSAGKIIRLELRENRLSGTIPAELGDLSELSWLLLDENQLSGTIPASLGMLSSLQYLYLDENQLSGTIPASLGMLSSLQYLYLHENQLEGAIPASLGMLSSLKRLYLNNNQLTGTIPPELGMLSNLKRLYLSNNPMLTGMLPEGLVDSDLETLNIRCTDISTPDTQVFNEWLESINFTGAECRETPLPDDDVDDMPTPPPSDDVDDMPTPPPSDDVDDMPTPPPSDDVDDMPTPPPGDDSEGGGGCALASDGGTVDGLGRELLNLLLIAFVLITISWKSSSGARQM